MKKRTPVDDLFLDVVKSKLSKNENIIDYLTKILHIEKEAVYRRLRKEVPFTIFEVSRISREIGISLDELMDIMPGNSSFQLKLTNHVDLEDIDFYMMEEYIKTLKYISAFPDSEYVEVANALVFPLYTQYQHITKFHNFKWNYLFRKKAVPFHEITTDKKVVDLNKEFIKSCKQIGRTCYILDKLIFQHFVNDILFFSEIQLVSAEDIRILKEELHQLLNELEQIANTGTFNTGNKVQLYISNINFQTGYIYISGPEYYLSMIKAFSLNAIASFDKKAFDKYKQWELSVRRLSTLISETGGKERVQFFKKQRKLVDMLNPDD